MNFIGIIPARYASSRFPGKPLADIMGKPMICHTYDSVHNSGITSLTVVATDDLRIEETAKASGARVIMTSPDHSSGTERCGEATRLLLQSGEINPEDVIINIQGDEPFMDAGQLRLLTSCFTDPHIEIATLIYRITNAEELFNPNKVKAVVDIDGSVMYFSRSTIPFLRDIPRDEWLLQHNFYRHLGIYAYKVKTLLKLVTLPAGQLEKAESLEQLRWMEYGYKIYSKVTDHENLSVDTPEDLEQLIYILKKKPKQL
ncbi:MAG: 3-deoxy-manno-octulosonate cytidylyltransferase [Bacteroidetes bacterium]|nr:3-deoxy-manno-octulosonate cytidylyltransferase [Bacteroidota bacterium]